MAPTNHCLEAQHMSKSKIDIKVGSGTMTTEVIVPDGKGPFGAVILMVDGAGFRPSQLEIGKRISKLGYLVYIPQLFFRSGTPFDLLPPGTPHDMSKFEGVFGDPALRGKFFTEYYSVAISYDHLREDVDAIFADLKKRTDWNGKVGTTGYCMGGNASLRVAALFGDKIQAAAAFHGGGLVADSPDSPHLRAKDIKAKVYVAGAIEDGSFTDENKKTLIETFAKEHVDAKVETYQARHGFVPTDHSTYDAAAAKRHDAALEAFYAATLQ
jgi:carboxymethylenebutenolidase